MRVLYVNQTAQVSGAERSLLALLQGLGDAVEPLVASPPGELAEEVLRAGAEALPIAGTAASFRLHPLHTSRGLAEIGRSALQVRRLVARHKPDLVHANTTRASLLALLARGWRGPPAIAHIRDWAPEGRFSRFVLATIARRASLAVANSAYIAGQFDGLPLRAPVRVIHNPVDLERFDPAVVDRAAARRELGLSTGVVALAVVSQLTPWKGQDDAIRLLAGLAEGDDDAVLLIAGSAKFSGPGTQFDNRGYERRLHELVTELGLGERVRFLGERADVPAILAATDVLLLPSWREAFGRIAIEAMAMSVPVAATEVGGPAEIVRDGVDGLLLPPRRPDVWAARLAPLIADAELRREYGGRARERAREFRVEAHAAAVLNVYRELLAGRRGGDAPL
ncbi:MAG: glycosyltransferase [Solirubrobacterales bacterium]